MGKHMTCNSVWMELEGGRKGEVGREHEEKETKSIKELLCRAYTVS